MSSLRPSKGGHPKMRDTNRPNSGTSMVPVIEKLWIFGLQKWRIIYMLPRLEDIRPLSQPHFGLSVRVKPTLPKVGFWSPPGLPKTHSSSSGSKHLPLGCYWGRWKGLVVYMSKMASHWPFGHLQPNLWAKEGLGVKLPV